VRRRAPPAQRQQGGQTGLGHGKPFALQLERSLSRLTAADHLLGPAPSALSGVGYRHLAARQDRCRDACVAGKATPNACWQQVVSLKLGDH